MDFKQKKKQSKLGIGGQTMRLIDADKFIEYLSAQRDVCIDYDDLLNAKVYQIAIDEIKRADTIDAEPVVHAHWIRNGLNNDFYCSNCNNKYIIRQTGRLPSFCGECGAKMDEEVEQK